MLKSKSRYIGNNQKYEMQKYYRSYAFGMLRGGAKSCLQNIYQTMDHGRIVLKIEPRHQRRTKF